jgi:hypothetical protein
MAETVIADMNVNWVSRVVEVCMAYIDGKLARGAADGACWRKGFGDVLQ